VADDDHAFSRFFKVKPTGAFANVVRQWPKGRAPVLPAGLNILYCCMLIEQLCCTLICMSTLAGNHPPNTSNLDPKLSTSFIPPSTGMLLYISVTIGRKHLQTPQSGPGWHLICTLHRCDIQILMLAGVPCGQYGQCCNWLDTKQPGVPLSSCCIAYWCS
jgi:hypothetical protein